MRKKKMIKRVQIWADKEFVRKMRSLFPEESDRRITQKIGMALDEAMYGRKKKNR